MTEAHKIEHPWVLPGGIPERRHVDPRVAAQAAADPRVSMVLQVIGGRPAEHVAGEWDIDPALLHRWVRDFLVAGSAAVTNRPDPDQALQRDRFLAGVAHELRTPIAVARGWAMVLADGDVPPDQVETTMARLGDAIDRLSDHILDIDLAASVSLGRLRVNTEPVDLVAITTALPGCSGITVGADLVVDADPQLLARILRDLWLTAQREPVPEQVTIEVHECASWHEIRVVRAGTPIGPMILKALFDPFGTNDDTTGVTMGLYIARALTVAHGGILGAEGTDLSTTLTVKLPRKTTVASAGTLPRSGTNKEETP